MNRPYIANAENLQRLGHGARGNRRGRIHEDHLEQEHAQDGHVDRISRQEEALVAKNLEGLAEEREFHHVVQDIGPVIRRQSTDTAHLECIPARPEPEDADPVDPEIHRHGVGGVLGTAKSGLEQGESCLHVHDQKATHHQPDDVQADLQKRGVPDDRLLGDLVLVLGQGAGGHGPGIVSRCVGSGCRLRRVRCGRGGGSRGILGVNEAGRRPARQGQARKSCKKYQHSSIAVRHGCPILLGLIDRMCTQVSIRTKRRAQCRDRLLARKCLERKGAYSVRV